MCFVREALKADDVHVGGDVDLAFKVIAGLMVDGRPADGDERGTGACLLSDPVYVLLRDLTGGRLQRAYHRGELDAVFKGHGSHLNR